jgi:L-aspartate oxidase
VTIPPDSDEVRLDAGDVLIVGAGLAGLFLALRLEARRAVVLSPSPLGTAAASAWAQGGLAAALAPEDSPAAHAADTVRAGAGLVDPAIARLLAEDGPARVRDLLALGVPFDRSEDGSLRLSLEAAHSHARVARVTGDLAGRAIMDALADAVRASGSIVVHEGLRAQALIRGENGAIAGILARDWQGRWIRILARETVLAVGGASALFAVTTNPVSATGVGLAMAAREGALIADPEFVQFHPTAIDVGRDPAPLATEALRGEGAVLVDRDGRPFMARHHPDAELAPRDVVARAIHRERLSGSGAYLDCRAAVGAHFPDAFPTVFKACMDAGIDPRREPIPVAPAAHYHMGGIAVDAWGRTTLPALSAVGECASTGAHGANRLASNSLLEAVVFAARIGDRLDGDSPSAESAAVPTTPPPSLADADRAELRATMSRHLGVERTKDDRSAVLTFLESLTARIGPATELIAARFIAEGAARRRESRGGHFCPDHPYTDDIPRRTFLVQGADGAIETMPWEIPA